MIVKLLNQIQENELIKVIKKLLYSAYNKYFRYRYQVITLKKVELSELGIDNELFHYHSFTDYLDFRTAMKGLRITPRRDVFIDFGSGMGAVIAMAATYPFFKIIGIETSPELNAIAKDLIERNKKRLQCKNIELVEGDAALFMIPPEATVFYLYNPFHGTVLDAVVKNIKESITNNPRKITLIFKNPIYFEKIGGLSDWLIEKRRFTCYWEHDCVVYEKN